MKIWIVFDSKFGNNRKVAEHLRRLLAEHHDVRCNYVKEVSPKEVLAFSPDVFLFGGPRHIGKISWTLRHWIGGFIKRVKAQKVQFQRVAAWETRGEMKAEDMQNATGIEKKIYDANLKIVDTWAALVREIPAMQPSIPLVSLDIVGMDEGKIDSGHLAPGWEEKIAEFVRQLNL